MPQRERSVLHVLPHAGGGGETYVDVLETMRGYRMRRVHITEQRKAPIVEVARGLVDVGRELRGHDLLHVHGEATAALFLPLLAARPSVVTLHGLHLFRRSSGARRRAAALNVRAIVRAASRTICVSNAERDELASVVGDSARPRVAVVHNGVHVAPPATGAERAAVRTELGLDPTEPVAIWVGSLDERRDPLVAVRAALAARTPLLFVGEGPLRGAVERAARAPVHVLGHRDDVPRLLGAADFFLLVSAREGLSFGLLEAMAHGLPAIVADIPENLEAIGDSGIAVRYGDEAELAAAVERLAGDERERAELGSRARRRVAELFSAEEMVARTAAVYDDVLTARPV
jgi:glycosyltransferase involved in cell wall biosynthesis